MSTLTDYLASKLDMPRNAVSFREHGKRVFTHFSFNHPDYPNPWDFEHAHAEQWGMEIPYWVFGNHFFGVGNYDPVWIDEDSLKARLANVPENRILICDLEDKEQPEDPEHGYQPYWYDDELKQPVFRQNIAEKRIRIGDIIKAERPDVQWGWWSMLPCCHSGWWWQFRDVWSSINDQLAIMAEQPHLIFPHHYMFGGTIWNGNYIPWWEQDQQHQYLVCLIREARRYNKPVYPFLSVWWYDHWKTPGKDQRVPYHRFIPFLHLAYYLGDGVALWHQKDYGCEDYPTWEENADWWQALRSLLLMEGTPPIDKLISEVFTLLSKEPS